MLISLRFIAHFITLLPISIINGSLQKCCASDSVLERNETRYECMKSPKKFRIELSTENVSINTTKEENVCTDIIDNDDGEVGNFKLNSTGNGLFIKIESGQHNSDFLPKCCPQNYFYNRKTHSCIGTDLSLPKCFRGAIIKIGLPHNCKIIEDLVDEVSIESNATTCTTSLGELKAKYDENRFCIDRDEKNSISILRVCRNNYDICKTEKCIRKCCPDGQSFVNGSFCRDTFSYGIDLKYFKEQIQKPNDPFVIVTGYRSSKIYRLVGDKFKFHLDDEGVFTMKEKDNTTNSYRLEEEEYCIEYFKKGSAEGYSFFRPFRKSYIPTKFVFTRYAMLVSAFFLMITMIYYCCSQEKRTVFGKTLISYCFISLTLYINLSYNAFDTRFSEKVCIILAFILIYSSMATFTWLNIMCIDIYCTFGSSKSFSSIHNKSKELKRFIMYSLYGWGCPLVLTTIPLIFYYYDILPSLLHVPLDPRKCFLRRGYGLLLFSTLPVALIEISDVILFLRTITYCLKVKSEISKMNDTHILKGDKKQIFEKCKDRLGLLIKLFLIMGVSFLFEIASQLYDFKLNDTTKTIELIGDTFNSLQGLFIFVIFICKPRVWKKIQKKIGFPKKIRKFSLISSNATQTTTASSTNRANNLKK